MDHTALIKEKTLQINGIFARLNGNVYNSSKALEESLKSTSEIDKICDSMAEQMRSVRKNNQLLHQQLYKKSERVQQLEIQITNLRKERDSLKKQLDDWDSEISASDESLLNVSGSSTASISVSVSPLQPNKETFCKSSTTASGKDTTVTKKKNTRKSSAKPDSDKDSTEPKEKLIRKSSKKTSESEASLGLQKETSRCSSKTSAGSDKGCTEPKKEAPNMSESDKDANEKVKTSGKCADTPGTESD